jgi:hypothetical protein
MSAIFLYKNLFDAATSVTGDGTVTGYPVTNLNLRQLSSRWRCSAFGTPKLTINFGAAKSFRCIVLAGINAGSASRNNDVTIEYSTDGSSWTSATFTLPVDAGCDSLPRTLVVMVGSAISPISRQYVRIGPNWTRAGGTSYYEIARVLIGNVLEIPEGCETGWTEGIYDPGQVDSSAGNQIYGDPRSTGRQITMPFPGGVPNLIARGFSPTATSASDVPSFQDMFLTIGATKEVFAAHTSESPLWLRRTGIYGRLTPESLALTKLPGDFHAANVTIIEER